MLWFQKSLEETMGDWPGRWVGEVHLWDKAEVLQWYSHHSKLHSANKEKTINKRKRKKPSDDKITGSTGWPSTSGFFLFNNNNNNKKEKVTLRPLCYVDCALLIRKQDKGNPLTVLTGSNDV